jgi:hypothetical protein
MRFFAWVSDRTCLDDECRAVGNATWEAVGNATWECWVVYCSEDCLLADGHKSTWRLQWETDVPVNNGHGLIGADVGEGVMEPYSCEYCGYCEKKVVQGFGDDCLCCRE